MTAFAEPADLATVLGETVDEDRAGLLLELASDAVRGELGQQLTETTSTVTVTARAGLLILPELPVTGIVTITAGGEPIPTTDYGWNPAGIISRTDCRPWTGTLTITYTHGYAAPPPAARRVALQVAVRAYGNPEQYQSETIGGYTYIKGPTQTAGTLGLTVAEKRDLDPLRP